jgi:hypothetical protein
MSMAVSGSRRNDLYLQDTRFNGTGVKDIALQRTRVQGAVDNSPFFKVLFPRRLVLKSLALKEPSL